MNSKLLERFYKGECSEEEVQAVLRWFRESKLGVEQESDLQALWQEAGNTEEMPERDSSLVFDKIQDKIAATQHQEPAGAGRLVKFRRPDTLQYWARIAAAVLLPLCLVGAFILYTSRSESARVSYRTVSTAPGVKKTIHLPDGSTIRLNAGSQVTFAENFAGKTRAVSLKGEAFFEVAKDSLRPFIVYTGCISTRALGTSFNIDYSKYDSTIIVALATGVVQVNKQEGKRNQKLSRLTPGQQLSYDRATKQMAVTSFDSQQVLGWKEGILYFRKADLEEVIRELENWYGVTIDVETGDSQDLDWDYTGQYRHETLEKVLEGIGFVKGFTFRRTGNHVKIMFNQSRSNG